MKKIYLYIYTNGLSYGGRFTVTRGNVNDGLPLYATSINNNGNSFATYDFNTNEFKKIYWFGNINQVLDVAKKMISTLYENYNEISCWYIDPKNEKNIIWIDNIKL